MGLKRFGIIIIITLLRDGQTALMKASKKGHEIIVTALLDIGGDVNAKDK